MATRGLAKATARGATWNAAETLLRLGLRVGLLAALARLLTPEDFGVFAAATVIIEFARPIATLSIDHSLVQRARLAPADVGTGLTIVAIGGMLACLLLVALAPLARWVFDASVVSEVVLALAPLLIASALADVAIAFLKRALAFRALAVIGFVCGALVNGGTALLLASLGYGYWALVGSFAVEIVLRLGIASALVWRYCRPSIARPNVGAARRLLRYGLGQTLARILNFLALHGDYLVVGGALGTAALGIYTRSYQLVAVAPGIFATVSGQVLFPVFSKLSEDRGALESAARAGLRLTALLGMPSAAILGVLAPECVRVLLGDGWGEAVLPLQIMSAGVFLRTGITFAGMIAMATARVYALAWRQLIYGAAVIGGGMLSVRFGMAGVATSTVTAMGVYYLLMAGLLRRATHLRWGAIVRELRGGATLAVAAGLVTFAAAASARALNLPAAGTLAIGGAAGILAVAALTFAAGKTILGRDLHGRLRTVLPISSR